MGYSGNNYLTRVRNNIKNIYVGVNFYIKSIVIGIGSFKTTFKLKRSYNWAFLKEKKVHVVVLP